MVNDAVDVLVNTFRPFQKFINPRVEKKMARVISLEKKEYHS